MTFAGATLVSSPASRDLAAYYCPELVSAPFGASTLLCQQLFGPRPNPRALTVALDLRLHVKNPNQIPLPLSSILAVATVFPTTASSQLGAVCLGLCPAGAVGCGPAQPGACEASSRDVRSLADFVNNAVPQLQIANGIALAAGQPPVFVAPQVVAASELIWWLATRSVRSSSWPSCASWPARPRATCARAESPPSPSPTGWRGRSGSTPVPSGESPWAGDRRRGPGRCRSPVSSRAERNRALGAAAV